MNLNSKKSKCWVKTSDTLNELKTPFNVQVFLQNFACQPNDTLYAKINPVIKELHPCVAVLKALAHIVNNEDSGYAPYKRGDEEGWISEYHPNSETYCVSMSFNNDTNDTVSVTVKNGVTTITDFMENPDAWFFHVLAGLNLGKLTSSQDPADVKKVVDNINLLKVSYESHSFDIFVSSEEGSKGIVAFTNDVFAECLCNGWDYDDFPILSLAKVDKNEIVSSEKKGNLEVVLGTKPKSKNAKKLLKDIKNFVVGTNSNTSDKYDNFECCPEVLKVCKIIKANALGKTKVPQNFLFTGVAGTGKSSAAYMIARACGLDYHFVVGSENLTMDELLVNTTLGDKPGEVIKVESPLVKAFRDGGIIEFQEANCIKRPNVIQFLNPLLDDNGELTLSTGEKLVRNPQTVIIFTANVGYEGTKQMNQALLSRCTAKFEFNLPTDEILCDRLVKKTGITKDIARKMVKVMHSVNKVLEEGGYSDGCCSYRELENWAQMAMMFGGIYDAAIITIVNSATSDLDGRAEVSEAVLTQFDEKETAQEIELN